MPPENEDPREQSPPAPDATVARELTPPAPPETTEASPALAQEGQPADARDAPPPAASAPQDTSPLPAQHIPAADTEGATPPAASAPQDTSPLLSQHIPAADTESATQPAAFAPPEAPGPLAQDASMTGGYGGPPPPPASRIARFRAWRFAPIFEVLGTIAIALVLAESVQAAVVKPFVIPSQSMEPTLMPGQRVLVNRLAYDFGGKPARGDIVVFHPPSSLVCRVNVPATEPCPVAGLKRSSQYFVKRVMGLPGDHLYIENGHPVINGRVISHEPYITPCADSTSCDMPHVITVPAGEYYMLGDNRGDSDDSRYWGPVPASWIIGEVFATYWPPDRIGIF
jgi:signal peptidase I